MASGLLHSFLLTIKGWHLLQPQRSSCTLVEAQCLQLESVELGVSWACSLARVLPAKGSWTLGCMEGWRARVTLPVCFLLGDTPRRRQVISIGEPAKCTLSVSLVKWFDGDSLCSLSARPRHLPTRQGHPLLHLSSQGWGVKVTGKQPWLEPQSVPSLGAFIFNRTFTVHFCIHCINKLGKAKLS